MQKLCADIVNIMYKSQAKKHKLNVDIVAWCSTNCLVWCCCMSLVILRIHDMQQASHKAEPDNYKHAVNDM